MKKIFHILPNAHLDPVWFWNQHEGLNEGVKTCSTIVKLKPAYLKSLSAGKHIIGVAYQDGKALAIFSVTDVNRRGVATGDDNDMTLWIAILGGSVVGLAVLCVVLAVTSRKRATRKKRKTTRK